MKVGAAFATRAFTIARPKVLQMRWYARAYGRVVWLLDPSRRRLEAIAAWCATRDFVHRAMSPIRAGIVRVWRWLRGETMQRSLRMVSPLPRDDEASSAIPPQRIMH